MVFWKSINAANPNGERSISGFKPKQTSSVDLRSSMTTDTSQYNNVTHMEHLPPDERSHSGRCRSRSNFAANRAPCLSFSVVGLSAWFSRDFKSVWTVSIHRSLGVRTQNVRAERSLMCQILWPIVLNSRDSICSWNSSGGPARRRISRTGNIVSIALEKASPESAPAAASSRCNNSSPRLKYFS